MPLFSIIIPHYKIPELLMRCLESIPVHPDFQVIVIDDCSPDAQHYLEQYPALSRPYLEFYSTPKGGSAGRARNIGLEHAKGRWIVCLDADDLFTPEAESLLRREVDNPADILFFHYLSVRNEDLSKPASRNIYQYLFTDFEKNGDERPMRYQFESMWGKVFRREMVETYHIRCDETSHSNDVTFSLQCGLNARTIAVLPEALFLITSREGSLASAQFAERKPSVKECQTRLGVALRAQDTLDKQKIRFDTMKYKYLAYQYWSAHQASFWGYFFRRLPRYPHSMLQIALYYLQNKHGEWKSGKK